MLVRGGTVWSAAGPRPADVLVEAGVVSAVGPGLEAPGDAEVVDARGL